MIRRTILKESTVLISLLGEERNELNEGPHWDEKNRMLYFVDIHTSSLLRYNPENKKFYRGKLNGTKSVGFAIPVNGTNNQFVVGADLDLLLVQWDGSSPDIKTVRTLVKIDDRKAGTRFNDAKVDFMGRLVAGTMLDGPGEPNDEILLSLGSDLTKQILLEHVGLSNGIAWNRELGKMYHCDSTKHTVTQYDYDEKTGVIRNPVVLINISVKKYKLPESAVPDGMTIDTEGILYIAVHGGGRVLQFDPIKKEIIHEIMIPAPQVTSVAFGGKDMNILFVTTAAEATNGKPVKDKNAGRLYTVKGLKAKGHKANMFVLDHKYLN
ncbi:regucalcin-like [Ctenocephalides felis]|uniref:regucalcin-like n=1 Tax=Ctenocephalides felis TaxID=7515 RepID=UPI000E6E5465|nr:regucalcin-like [Ctenocephalides felis]